MSFNQISFGEPKRNESPSVNVKSPTESGNPPTLDPQGWIPQGQFTGATANVTYETGVPGDMLLLFVHETSGSGTGNIPTPSGWAKVFYDLFGSGDAIAVAFFAKIADGTETGSLTLSGIPNPGAYTATNRIKANGATLSIAAIIKATGSGAHANPPAIALTGADKYIGLTGWNFQTLGGTSTHTAGDAPTGYTEEVHQFNSSSDPSMHIGQKLISGSGTEDPDAGFGVPSGAYRSVTWTVGIPIDAAPSPLDHTHTENEVTDHTTLTQKVTPVVADVLKIHDSEDSFNPKWIEIDDLPGGGSDHGSLTGLADDDHTQYLLAAGTRAATYLEVSGLTGATGSSPRFVGGTTSGAPVSGTFALGDYVVTEDGNIYVCTTAGTPGTWTAVGAGAATDADAIHDNVAGEIAALTLVTAASGDHVLIEDASDANNKKRVAASDFLGGGGGGVTVVNETTVSSSVSDVTITGIAATFEYLELILELKSDRASREEDGLRIQLGDGSIDATGPYSYFSRRAGSSSGASSSVSDTKINIPVCTAAAAANSTDRGVLVVQIHSYADSGQDTRLTYHGGFANDAWTTLTDGQGVYRVQNVVDQIKITPEVGTNWAAGRVLLLGY